MNKALLSLVPLLLLPLAGCAANTSDAPADDGAQENASVDGPNVGEQSEPLINRCSSGTTSLSGSAAAFNVSANVVGVGESRPPVASASSTIAIPVGRTTTTITTSPRLDAGLGLSGPPLAGWEEANVRLRLVVTGADGTVLCDQPRDVVNRSQPGGFTTDSIPNATAVPISCTFNHAPIAQTVTARLEMSAYALAAAIPGEAHASGRISATFGLPTVSRTSCSEEVGWCIHNGARLLSLDINGDGKTDHVCHTASTSNIQVNTTPSSGVPDDVVDFDVNGFCGGTDVLVTGDVNGDHRDDLVCVTPSTGRVRVNLASASGFYSGATDIQTNPVGRQCFDPVLADFNGDGRVDLLCRSGLASASAPAIFLNVGGQYATRSSFPPPACVNVRSGIHQYIAGDVNADGRADLVCNGQIGTDPATADTTVFFSNGNGTFSLHQHVGVFCSHTGARLALADTNADNREDLVCLTTGTGQTWVAPADTSGTFFPQFSPGNFINFCTGGGPVTTIDYTGSGREGLTCQIPAVGSTLGSIQLFRP